MAKSSKGFGTPLEQSKKTKSTEKIRITSRKERLKTIVGQDGTIATVSLKTLAVYQKYLEKKMKRPCLLTGRKSLPWEEPYIRGDRSEKEYELYQKTNASYRDIFKLLGFESKSKTYSIHVKVRRVSDQRKFELPLDYLKPVDKKHPNSELILDYTNWLLNWQ